MACLPLCSLNSTWCQDCMDMSHSPVHPCRTLVYIFPRHKDRISISVSVSLKHYGSRHSSEILGCPLCLSRFEALWPPSSGEASSSIMRGIFIVGVVAAFAITVVGKRGHTSPFVIQCSFPPRRNILALGVLWYLPPGLLCCERTHVSTLPSERPLYG